MSHISLSTEHAQVSLSDELFASMKEKLRNEELPAFHQHNPDIPALKEMLEPYKRFPNIIIIANGGSRTSALAYWQSLAHLRNDVNIEFLSTMEPDVVAMLQKQYSTEDTLVMPVSKSGTNVDVLEPLFAFMEAGYSILPVTSPNKGVLYEIALKYEWDIVPHPEVGGRYSGRTECGLAPAYLMGLDIDAIDAGAVEAYDRFGYNAPLEQNPAFIAAAMCYALDTQGKDEIFMPVYSVPVSGFLPLAVQLIHESTGKDGKGQTVFGDMAPESQHHTNQRFFGGKQNVIGMFVVVESQHNAGMTITVPEAIQDLPLREGTLANLHGIPMADGLRFDYEGVAENATQMNIPHMTVHVDSVTPESMGELLSFLHYYTVYASLLRDQDPFDQPAVEGSKSVSFEKRMNFSV